MDTLRELVAGELRATLARKRISAAALARQLGWSQTYMARRVDGRAPLDVDDLEKIADVLEVTVADLLPRRQRAVTNGSSSILAEPAAPHAVRVMSPRGAARSATRRPVRTGRAPHSVSDRSPVVA